MSTDFGVITEEFREDLEAIRSLVSAFDDPHKGSARARIAAANSATLLLAATFEEFVREMARAYARAVVSGTTSFDKLPSKLARLAWRRTMESLARIRIDPRSKVFSAESIFSDALTRFNTVYEFCKGDLTQDIYSELIYNENNMRPTEINSLFSVSGLVDVCLRISDKTPLLEKCSESESAKAHGRLITYLEEFFERRNAIAHSLSRRYSSGSDQIRKDVDMFEALGMSLCETLEALIPKEVAAAPAGATEAVAPSAMGILHTEVPPPESPAG